MSDTAADCMPQTPQQPAQIRYLDTSPDEENEHDFSPPALTSGSMPDNFSAPAQQLQGAFAILAQNFPTAEKVKDSEAENVDDNFALFGLDRGVEVVNLDPTDSDRADEESGSTRSDSSAESLSVGDLARKMFSNKLKAPFSGQLSSINKGDAYNGDSSDDSDQHRILSQYGLGNFSMSCPSRTSGVHRVTINSNRTKSRKLCVLTPEEKRRRREAALRKREELQLSACTFRCEHVSYYFLLSSIQAPR